jgi:hypothetical protein
VLGDPRGVLDTFDGAIGRPDPGFQATKWSVTNDGPTLIDAAVSKELPPVGLRALRNGGMSRASALCVKAKAGSNTAFGEGVLLRRFVKQLAGADFLQKRASAPDCARAPASHAKGKQAIPDWRTALQPETAILEG